MGNLSFEIPGAGKGEAQDWAVAEVHNGREYASLDASFECMEDFEEEYLDNELFLWAYIEATHLVFADVLGLSYETWELAWSIEDMMSADKDEQAKLVGTGHTPAVFRTGTAGPWNFTAGWILQYEVDGGATKTIPLDVADFININAATAAEMVRVLQRDLVGATAVLVDTTTLEILTETHGDLATLDILAGDITGEWGYFGLVASTGETQSQGWPDGHAGFASVWNAAIEEFALINPDAPLTDVETFEAGWLLPGRQLARGNHVFATKYWDAGTEQWMYEAAQLEMATLSGPKDVEDFEDGWADNEDYADSYPDTPGYLKRAGLGAEVGFGQVSVGAGWQAAVTPPSYVPKQYSPRLWLKVITAPASTTSVELVFTDEVGNTGLTVTVSVPTTAAVGSYVYAVLSATPGAGARGVTAVTDGAILSGTGGVFEVKGDTAAFEEYNDTDWTTSSIL